MQIDESRQLGRAKNAILSLFERRLSVPKIYLDAEWAGNVVDVLAINRDGVGDVHAVLMFARPMSPKSRHEEEEITALIHRFTAIPAQYKYVAAIDVTEDGVLGSLQIPDRVQEQTFADDGLGRIGFMEAQARHNHEPAAKIVVAPERFRAAIASLADEYIQHHAADWEIRA